MSEQELTRDQKIDRIIELFESVEAALEFFVKLGTIAAKILKGITIIAGCGGAVFTFITAWKKLQL